MNDLKDLELIIESGISIIFIESSDEPGIEMMCKRLGSRFGKTVSKWTITTGLVALEQASSQRSKEQKLASVLANIAQMKQPGIFLCLDAHPWMDDPLTVRLLREIAQDDKTDHTLILTGPEFDIPKELKTIAARFEFTLPTTEQLHTLIKKESSKWGEKNHRSVKASKEVIEALTRNLLGLTLNDARRLVKNAIYDDGILTEDDIPKVIKEKYKLLDTDGVLSFELDTGKFNDVAGLRNLKKWLKRRKKIFLSSEAPKGLDPTKGVLLLGVQGGGKSLAAKSVAGSWGIPLLRLDFGALYNKYYGETERNLRQSLKSAEAMAPCVLWIDEIEKGISTDSSDGGPSKRVLGTLLTWMAERKSKVFLVATANDIEALPPELLRKGRFDEIFFIDLPSEEVRIEIFRIHLRKRDINPETIDLTALGEASVKFSGAEIEQAVVSSLYTSHAQDEELTTEHILEEIKTTRPLAVLMAEKIEYLRDWAESRTVPAD